MTRHIRPIVVMLALTTGASATDPPGAAVKLSSIPPTTSNLRVHFIDVGHGLGMLIETPGDKLHVFIDGGNRSSDENLVRYAEHFIEDGIIDIAIVTHADTDHYRGMRRMFDEFDVKQFWNTGYTSDKISGETKEWTKFLKKVAAEPGCDVYSPLNAWVALGDREVIDEQDAADPTDDVVVQYLNIDDQPPERDPFSDRRFNEGERRNNASLVFKLIYRDVSFLVTGDINGRPKNDKPDGYIDSEELELFIRHHWYPEKYGLKATVLQVPHHGSHGSVSLPFVQAVDPEWAVVPAGTSYHHPRPGAVRRLEAVLADNHILYTNDGNSTPPSEPNHDDANGDDSFIFETDGVAITAIHRVTWHE